MVQEIADDAQRGQYPSALNGLRAPMMGLLVTGFGSTPALTEVGRQVEVGHGLAAAARPEIQRADRHDIASVKIAARTFVQDEVLAVAPQRARLRLGALEPRCGTDL